MPSSVRDIEKLENSNLLVNNYDKSELESYLAKLPGLKEPLAFYSFVKACKVRGYKNLAQKALTLSGNSLLCSSFANKNKAMQWRKYLLQPALSLAPINKLVLVTMGSYNGKYDPNSNRLFIDELSELSRWLQSGGSEDTFINITFDRVAHEANTDLKLGHNYFGNFWDCTRDPNGDVICDLSKLLKGKSLVVHMDTQEKVCLGLIAEATKTMGYMLNKFPRTSMLFALNVVLRLGGTAGTYTRQHAKVLFDKQFAFLGGKSLKPRNSTTNGSKSEMGCFYYMFKR